MPEDFDSMVVLHVWSVWKARNSRVFPDESLDLLAVAYGIKVEVERGDRATTTGRAS